MEYGPLIILATSLLGVPIIYFVNSTQGAHGEATLFIIGTVALVLMCVINYIAVRYFSNIPEPTWLILAFVIGTFASAIDLMIGLEADGLVSGFMTAYLKQGEPYLGTPYGIVVCYWDGIVHYLLYAIMLMFMAFRKDYRLYGLYWAGSIGHSMLVLIPGAVIGKFGVRWAILLNTPYMAFPFMAAARFLNLRPPTKLVNSQNSSASHRKISGSEKLGKSEATLRSQGIFSRPLDTFLIVTLVLSLAVAVFRGAAVLGCIHDVTRDYIQHYEPYLSDPIGHPKVQILVYLFYFVPFYIMAINALLNNSTASNAWLLDWSLIFAGAAAQAQFPHLFAPFKSGTSPQYKIPEQTQFVFLAINIFLLVQPQILAIRCVSYHLKHKVYNEKSGSNKNVMHDKKE